MIWFNFCLIDGSSNLIGLLPLILDVWDVLLWSFRDDEDDDSDDIYQQYLLGWWHRYYTHLFLYIQISHQLIIFQHILIVAHFLGFVILYMENSTCLIKINDEYS